MALNTLRDLLLEETNRLYDGVEQVVHTLPSVVNVATERRLRDTLESYLGDKRRQRLRIEEAIARLGVEPTPIKCEAVHTLLGELNDRIRGKVESHVLDAALVTEFQRLIHYQMVLFGTVRAYADELHDADLEDLFDECLDEEKKANKRLTKLALTGINEAAAEQPMVHNP